jgi:cyclopropane-fatty-acyl-phospholipid synthase
MRLGRPRAVPCRNDWSGVTAITLSKEQHAFASANAAEKGLAGSVDFRLQDYRDLAGKFDRIVSVFRWECSSMSGLDSTTPFFVNVQDCSTTAA